MWKMCVKDKFMFNLIVNAIYHFLKQLAQEKVIFNVKFSLANLPTKFYLHQQRKN